jgi:hypothetical protein
MSPSAGLITAGMFWIGRHANAALMNIGVLVAGRFHVFNASQKDTRLQLSSNERSVWFHKARLMRCR